MIKKLLLTLLALLLVMQIPFAYRRYRLGRAADQIKANEAARSESSDVRFDEYKGVIHAHTGLGGHSTGNFDELISGADAAGLDFVLMTEHWSDSYDTSALTLNGRYANTLFVGGNEVDTADGDRFLMIPGSNDAPQLRKMSTAAVLDKLHAEKRLALITYPEKFVSWNSDFDGIEVFSLHTAATQMNRFATLFDILWSGRSYPELTFARTFRRPDENLAKFDEMAAKRKISLFAGTDAHSNIGFHIFGDDAGHKWLNFKLDPYRTSFRLARMHVLLPKGTALTQESLVDAVRAGRFFTGFDAIGDTTGFRFSAGDKTFGDEIPLSPVLTLDVSAPQKARIVTLKNGAKFDEQTDAQNATIKPDGPGVYRVELYLDGLGTPFSEMPWIMSDPIYVR